jgi:hypothetical protein
MYVCRFQHKLGIGGLVLLSHGESDTYSHFHKWAFPVATDQLNAENHKSGCRTTAKSRQEDTLV